MFRQLRQFQGVRARISRQRVQEMEGGAGSVPEIFGAIRLGEDLGWNTSAIAPLPGAAGLGRMITTIELVSELTFVAAFIEIPIFWPNSTKDSTKVADKVATTPVLGQDF